MAIEYVILIAIAALIVGLFANLKSHDKAAKTLAETWFGNISEPRFYVQRDPTPEAAQSARAEWETAVKMLQECGNRFIHESDLHLWLFRASENNEKVEFSTWELLCSENARKIREAFIAEKNKNLNGKPGEMADVVWGKNEN